MTALWDEKNEITVVEDQLVLAKTMVNQLVELETKIKGLEKVKKAINEKLTTVMGDNNISSYESNDNRLRISYSIGGTTETIDKEKLFKLYPEAYRECVKESVRKPSVRVTVREVTNE